MCCSWVKAQVVVFYCLPRAKIFKQRKTLVESLPNKNHLLLHNGERLGDCLGGGGGGWEFRSWRSQKFIYENLKSIKLVRIYEILSFYTLVDRARNSYTRISKNTRTCTGESNFRILFIAYINGIQQLIYNNMDLITLESI